MKENLGSNLGRLAVTRRKVLLAGAVIAASGLVTSSLPAFALPQVPANLPPFMQLSRLLVNHNLDDQVGQRMLVLLQHEESTLIDDIHKLLVIARQNNARVVEDFFPTIPVGRLQDLAYKIIFGWYTGSLAPTRTAKCFAFELALTWQTTSDAITVPSYAISGPNNWSRPNVPLSNMPTF